MSKVTEYEQLKREIARSKQWYSMLGKRYVGGGGGIGAIASATCAAEIYFQERDGSNNYHEIEGAVKRELQLVFKAALPVLLEKAFANLEEQRLAAAKLATEEYAKLLTEAGVENNS
jgi:hypothetical protein